MELAISTALLYFLKNFQRLSSRITADQKLMHAFTRNFHQFIENSTYFVLRHKMSFWWWWCCHHLLLFCLRRWRYRNPMRIYQKLEEVPFRYFITYVHWHMWLNSCGHIILKTIYYVTSNRLTVWGLTTKSNTTISSPFSGSNCLH